MNYLITSIVFGALSMTTRIQGQAPGLCESCLQNCARALTSIQICNDQVGFCNGAYLGQSCGGPTRSVCCSAGSCAIATVPPNPIEILYVGPFPFNICQAVTCIFGVCDDFDFETPAPTKIPTASTSNPSMAPVGTPTKAPTASTSNPSVAPSSPTKTPSFILGDSSDSSDSSDSDDFFDDFDISDIFDFFDGLDGDYGERLDEFINMVLENYCRENPLNCLAFNPAAHSVISANKSTEIISKTDDNVIDAESLEITLNVNGSIWQILFGVLMAILNIFVCWYFNKSEKGVNIVEQLNV